MPPKVTVLQLDTHFPRVAGDVACPDTYLGELEIIRVKTATVRQIVSNRPELIDIKPFESALDRATGDVIATSCGFLSYWQDYLAARTSTLFVSSALIAFDNLSQVFQPDEVLTLTFDADSLSDKHFGAYAAFRSGVTGLPADMHLRHVISNDLEKLDVDLARKELVDFIATKHQTQHKHLVLECTNLPPYKATLRRETGLNITDILTCIEAVQQGSVKPKFLS
jgi:hypothetical protein|tara:strand:- start:1272 stop:1943 length:672 start_codon:yes stop_codon:yes gene_type:complete